MNPLRPISYLTFLLLFFISCAKDEVFDPIAQFELEQAQIKTYVDKYYPDMIYSSDTTGIWYELIESDTSTSYTYKIVDTINYYGQPVKGVRMPIISVKHTGKLISDNSTFASHIDKSDSLVSKLDKQIAAWYYAFVPKGIEKYKIGGLTTNGLQKGSKIRIITPSDFAYGNRPNGAIPANSPLFFEIEVLDIK